MKTLPVGDWRLAVYGARSSQGAYRKRPRQIDQQQIVAIQGNECLYCGIPIGTRIWRKVRARRSNQGLTVVLQRQWDHFVPYAFLEQNPSANWVLACHICNRIKSARMFNTIAEARGVILPERESRGYEPVREVLARIALDPVGEEAEGSVALTNSQAAMLLGVSPKKLTQWRSKGGGPGWTRSGSQVQYDRDDVLRWKRTRELRLAASVGGVPGARKADDR